MSSSADYSLTTFQAAPERFRFGPAPSAITADSGLRLSFKLLILFLLVLYSNLAQLYAPLNAARPALLVAAAATAMMVIEIARDRQSFKLAWPQGYLLLALIGVAVVSTFQAIYVRLGFNTTTDLAKIALIYIVIENTVNSESRVRSILWTLVIGGIFPALGTIHHYVEGIFIEGTRAAWIGIFGNPNEDAYALVILTPVALTLANTSRWMVRIALWGIVGLYVLATYLTFSRGGLLGLFAVLALFGWKQKSVILKMGMIGGMAASLMVVGLFWGRQGNFSDLATDTTVNQRITTIKAGLAMFADNPILGVGPGCSLVAYPLYVPKDPMCSCQDQLVIHNAFIQILSEVGLLGFLPFMGLFAVTIFQLWKIQRTNSLSNLRMYAMGCELALWGFVACGLSGGFSYTWFPYILLGVGVAIKRVHDQMQHNEVACRA
jgi:putative inorganic carbon (hco3(-)) transporter